MPSKSKKQHDFMEAIAHNKAFAKKVGVPQSVGEDFVNADKGKHFSKGGIDMATRKRGVNPAMALMAARAMQAPPAGPAAPMAAPGGAPMGAPGMKHGGLSKAHHKHLAHHHLSMAEHHMAMHEGHHKTTKMAHGGHAYEKMHEMNQAKELRRIAKEEEHEASAMKHGGKAHKMAHGGFADGKSIKAGEKHLKHGEHADQKKGHTRGKNFGDSGKVEPIETEHNIKSFEKEGMKHGGHVKKMAHGGATHHRADGIAQRGHTKTKFC